MKKHNPIMFFQYDSEDNVVSMTFEGTRYYYIKNLQGDIMKIIDKSGNVVVTYKYDSWGNLCGMTDTSGAWGIGSMNPFRYRSYVYDDNTGLYYLRSRYYDPVTGRFLNADDIAYIGITGTPLSTNMFAYCENNPVMGYDPQGYWDWNLHKTLCKNAKFNSTICQWAYNADTDTEQMPLKSNNYYSAPFHSRKESLKIFKCLYNNAIKIKNNKKMIKLNFGHRLVNELKYIKKGNNKEETKNAQNTFLKLINPTKYKGGKCKSYKEQCHRLMGLALHTLQDYFAHRINIDVYNRKGGKKIYNTMTTTEFSNDILHDTKAFEDNVDVLSWRVGYTKFATNRVKQLYSGGYYISYINKEFVQKSGEKFSYAGKKYYIEYKQHILHIGGYLK